MEESGHATAAPNELAPLHSITSSAPAMSVGGTSVRCAAPLRLHW
jgi:hypothetical protein